MAHMSSMGLFHVHWLSLMGLFYDVKPPNCTLYIPFLSIGVKSRDDDVQNNGIMQFFFFCHMKIWLSRFLLTLIRREDR